MDHVKQCKGVVVIYDNPRASSKTAIGQRQCARTFTNGEEWCYMHLQQAPESVRLAYGQKRGYVLEQCRGNAKSTGRRCKIMVRLGIAGKGPAHFCHWHLSQTEGKHHAQATAEEKKVVTTPVPLKTPPFVKKTPVPFVLKQSPIANLKTNPFPQVEPFLAKTPPVLAFEMKNPSVVHKTPYVNVYPKLPSKKQPEVAAKQPEVAKKGPWFTSTNPDVFTPRTWKQPIPGVNFDLKYEPDSDSEPEQPPVATKEPAEEIKVAPIAKTRCSGVAKSTGLQCRLSTLNPNGYCDKHQSLTEGKHQAQNREMHQSQVQVEIKIPEVPPVPEVLPVQDEVAEVEAFDPDQIFEPVVARQQCGGIAKSTGLQCRLMTADPTGFCTKHQAQVPPSKTRVPPDAPVAVEVAPEVSEIVEVQERRGGQCQAVAVSTGEQCRVRGGRVVGGFCNKHRHLSD